MYQNYTYNAAPTICAHHWHLFVLPVFLLKCKIWVFYLKVIMTENDSQTSGPLYKKWTFSVVLLPKIFSASTV